MPSSTSSSKRSRPPGPWPLVWAATAALVVLAALSLELGWRALGHRPSVVDDRALWSVQRAALVGGGPRTIALLGASRMQTDVDLRLMRRLLPDRRVYMLAVDGSPPTPVLIDLAGDASFSGTVICSVLPQQLYYRELGRQQKYVEYYEDRFTLERSINRRLVTLLQSRLAMIHPRINLRSVVQSWLEEGSLPDPYYVVTHADRSRSAHYDMVDAAEARRERIERVQRFYRRIDTPPPEKWLARAVWVEPYVKAIQDRGGRVVFVRLPSCGRHWELDQKYFPKGSYWDRFAARTEAETLHFKDAPALTGFDCPDASHIDSKDAPAFTRALTAELAERGLIARRAHRAGRLTMRSGCSTAGAGMGLVNKGPQ